ncbi:tRNA pseudouridine(38-40) synthase TruA [Glacieibacterium sp.]|uniref:tRNA pseudouridine(38-40) synthase TruA n=1 Tax=Glacieibacterium sp. TaxID=2860237 RepID=UPI003B003B61
MSRFRLTIEYDGRPFVGWQRQLNGSSIQAAIEAAVFAISGERTTVYAAGRTDAGVHAAAMVAHVDIAKPIAASRLIGGLNAYLRPAPISIIGCEDAADDFHARFDCTARYYRYIIVNRHAPLTYERGLAWQVRAPLDAEAMHEAAQLLVGRHDFTTFRSAHCQSSSPVKTLTSLDAQRQGDHIYLRSAARSFLHHQVRSMVGCLKLVGEGRWTASQLAAALEARDRNALGFNAPPDGLTFMAATYKVSGNLTTS